MQKFNIIEVEVLCGADTILNHSMIMEIFITFLVISVYLTTIVFFPLLLYSTPNTDSNNTYGGGGGGGQDERSGGHGENEQPPKVVLNTTAAILPRLKDFHNLLLDPPQVSACLNSWSLFHVSVNHLMLNIIHA
jgi:hypothetical protein